MSIAERIIAHWTGGPGRATADDKDHYHLVVEHDGTVVLGHEQIEDNVVTSDGDYAGHTLNLNTKSIGIAVCGMHDATENPFNPGPYPINEKQFRKFCATIAALCMEYNIEVTPETVLTHAEVEPNLGVKQQNKWDITRVPWRDDLRGARAVGDHMRSIVNEYLGAAPQRPANQPSYTTLRPGNRTRDPAVVRLQEILTALRYFVGKKDGLFGPRTEASVRAFQQDNGLTPDGIVGDKTWEALLYEGEVRPERDIDGDELKAKGSRTVKAARDGKAASTALTAGGVLTWFLGNSEQVGPALENAESALGRAQALLINCWLPIGVVALGVAAYFVFNRFEKFRVQDARTGANDRI